MSSPAISVERLSKAYRIGAKEEVPDTLVGAVKSIFGSPVRNWRQLRELDTSRTSARSANLNGDDGSDPETLWALRDVSFEIHEGEVVGIIGRNGAGKSTLLKVLSRITEPTSGRVVIRGRVSSLLEVGTGFHPELSGRDNIYMNGTILGMTKREIDRKFDEIIEFSGVERFLDTPTKRYSSGMQVRLAFAVAAHLEPEILIIDEVLAVGDAEFQKKCMGKMRDVAEGGRTVLFVSHNMAAVSALCTRCILLRDGKHSDDGSPMDIIPSYLGDASSQSNGVCDLSDHPARHPGMQPIVQSVAILIDGQPRSILFPADRVTVRLGIKHHEPIKDARLAVAIEDSFGRRITTCATYFSNPASLNLPAAASVDCNIGALRLGAGRYLLSVSVGTQSDGMLDSVDGAVSFEVRWNNNFGNGLPYQPVYGPVLTESDWCVRPNWDPEIRDASAAVSGRS